MKKRIIILIGLLALGLAFLLGWRGMPVIWPHIKKAVVYPLLPQMRPAPAPTQEPYVPHSTASLSDSITEKDSLIYYFYKEYCPYCRELEPLMAGLPKQITLKDGTVSDVRLVCLNKVEEECQQVATRYYDEHQIDEDHRFVPGVVIGERYLYLEHEIIEQLMDALVQGEGLNTPLLNGAQRIKVDQN